MTFFVRHILPLLFQINIRSIFCPFYQISVTVYFYIILILEYLLLLYNSGFTHDKTFFHLLNKIKNTFTVTFLQTV